MNSADKKPELTILHISDLHFGPPLVIEVAEAALRSAHELKPDAIVVSGDVTQRATRDQFIAAKEFLNRLPSVPQLVIPGNHDVPLYRVIKRYTKPLELYQAIICENLNPVLKIKNAILVGLDSTSPRRAISGGRVFDWQLDACHQAFLDAPESTAKIIVAHHHFAPAPDNLFDWKMPKSKRAIMRFVELDVDLILGGHLHRAYIGNSLDFYPGIHRDRGIIIAQCGTTTSRRGRGREQEKNTFNVIEVYEQTIDIAHYLYFDSADGFIPTSRHSFRRYRESTKIGLPSQEPKIQAPSDN